MSNADGRLMLGLDVGSVSVKGLILDANGRIRGRAIAALESDARAVVLQVLRSLLPEPACPVLVGVTGSGKGLLDELPGAVCENDLVATARAVGVLLPEIRGVIEIGGHQSKWMRLGPGAQMESFALNDQCAAGSGAFLEQQAGRLRLDIRELSALAASAGSMRSSARGWTRSNAGRAPTYARWAACTQAAAWPASATSASATASATEPRFLPAIPIWSGRSRNGWNRTPVASPVSGPPGSRALP